MKKHSLIYLLAAGLIGLSSVALSSCSEDDEVGLNDVLSVKSVLPLKVIAGQEVTITGTGLENATAVVFPGGAEVTDFTIGGNGYLTVKTPTGIAAEGGEISVKAGDEIATAAATLTVGQPKVNAVLPLGSEIKINEVLQVFGSDLEFIEKAIFPGADGTDVVVNASRFKRKATAQVFIYVPKGVAAGPANVQLEDCSGAKYTLPEVLLSDKVSGETSGPAEVGTVIYEGSFEVTDWNWFEPNCTDFNFQGYAPKAGQQLKFVISGAKDDSRFCYCRGDWSTIDLGGETDPNNIGITSSTTEVVVTLTQDLVNDLTTGYPVFHVSGTNFVIERLILLPMVLWEGECYVENWEAWKNFYAGNGDFDLVFGDLVPEEGDTLRITIADHDSGVGFCLCLGSSWWAPDLGGSPDANNITVPADQNVIDCYLTADGATHIKDRIILGGEAYTILRLELLGKQL